MEKKIRENVGFIIMASRMSRYKGEIVLGFNPTSSQYVTWQYDAKSGYNYGHYFSEFFTAVEDFKYRGEK